MAADLLWLMSNATRLKRVAATGGGEYAGPCPFCGGTDRFRVWPHGERGRWWCRRCLRSGDAITFLREYEGLSFAEARDRIDGIATDRPSTGLDRSGGAHTRRRDCGSVPVRPEPPNHDAAPGVGQNKSAHQHGVEPNPGGQGRSHSPYDRTPFDWTEADCRVSTAHGPLPVAQDPPPHRDQPPPDRWQRRARSLIKTAQDCLWSDEGTRARRYLRDQRGLSDGTIERWGLGFISTDAWEDADTWDLENHARVWLPRGIVIPLEMSGRLWGLKIRRPPSPDGRKYLHIRGSRPALFGADKLRSGNEPRRIVFLTEGEFDAMLLHQQAGDLAGVATTGSCSNRLDATRLWLLRDARHILVAYDLDAAGAGGAAAIAALSDRVHLVKPLDAKDLTDMHLAGGNLRAWARRHTSAVTADVDRSDPQRGPRRPAPNVDRPAATPDEAHRSRWSRDPRPDLASDSHRWEQLLPRAFDLDGDNPRGLFGALHGLRCLGTILDDPRSGFRLICGEIDPGEFEDLHDEWLLPHEAALRGALTLQLGLPVTRSDLA